MAKDETRIVGNLPNLRMEIVHRQDPEGGAEHMSIHLSAAPSFQAAEKLLLDSLSPAAWTNPFALWVDMAQAWLAPWTGVPDDDAPGTALPPSRDPLGRDPE